ncbi:MAG: phosphopentomutase [candidate division NC10 bacterium]|nr:phosphopentomutase [candidate division NC10 bacterium]
MIILDGLGIGELPDACIYGDEGSNTLGNLARTVARLSLPHLEAFGLGNLGDFQGIKPRSSPGAVIGRLAEASPGKDTTTGHWELMGLPLDSPFPTYPQGFPPEVIEPFQKAIGRKVLGNFPASGTDIIARLGKEHLRTGCPIVYTSADSVFQVATHEEVIPLQELYQICFKARELLTGNHAVARVIARPFRGRPGSFYRTGNRRDFSLVPPKETLLDRLSTVGIPVIGIGKIGDLFAGQGISLSIPAKSNKEVTDGVLDQMSLLDRGLIFANLVDFDTLYGHRNDPQGFAAALEEFDRRLPEIKGLMRPEDVLFITSDHGCDPTTPSTDHSREYVPLLVYGARVEPGRDLGIRKSFADVGQTMGEIFGVGPLQAGISFWDVIKKGNHP